jgi:hypothetical protein
MFESSVHRISPIYGRGEKNMEKIQRDTKVKRLGQILLSGVAAFFLANLGG